MNNIIHGNSEKILLSFKDKYFDCCVTSPPYFRNKKYEKGVSYIEYLNMIKKVFYQIYRTLSNNGLFFLNVNSSAKKPELSFDLLQIARDVGFNFVQEIIWFRRNSTHYRSNKRLVDVKEFIFILSKTKDYNIYPTQFMVESQDTYHRYDEKPITNLWNIPIYLNNQFLKRNTTTASFPIDIPLRCISIIDKKFKLILDPFAGIGQTAKACLKLDKEYIMIEKEKDFVDIMVKELKEK